MGLFSFLGKAATWVGKNLPVVGGAVQNFIDNKNTAEQNRLNREFAEQQQDKQNAFNRQMWDLNNTYNSPAEQMKRARDAGLNPHAAFGNVTGNVASAPVRSAEASFHAEKKSAPDIAGALALMTNMNVANAQVSNLRASTDDKLADALLKAIDSLTRDDLNQANLNKTAVDTATSRASGMLSDSKRFTEDKLRNLSADALREDIRKKRVESTVLVNRDAREAVLQSKTLEEMSARIANIYGITNKTALEASIIKMDADLRRDGIFPNDPFYARAVAQLALKNKKMSEMESRGRKDALKHRMDNPKNSFDYSVDRLYQRADSLRRKP